MLLSGTLFMSVQWFTVVKLRNKFISIIKNGTTEQFETKHEFISFATGVSEVQGSKGFKGFRGATFLKLGLVMFRCETCSHSHA